MESRMCCHSERGAFVWHSAQSEATASRTMKSSRRYVNSTILLLLFLCFHTPYNIKLFCVFEKTGRTTTNDDGGGGCGYGFGGDHSGF